MGRNKSYVPRKYEKIASLSTTIGNLLLWPFVFLNLYVGKMPMFFVALGFVVMLNIFYVLFRKSKNFSLWSTAVIVLLGISVAFAFGDGGLQETGHLWVFVFPLLAYELKGPDIGSRYVASFYVFLGLVYFIALYSGFSPAYQTPLFMVVFFLVLLAVTAVLYSYHRLKNTSLPARHEMKLPPKSGKACWVDHLVSLIQYDNKPATIGTIYDFTEIQEAREKISFQHDFFKMVAAISGSFINVYTDTLDDKINSMLKDCGQFLGVDRTFLFQFSKDLQYMSNTHEWSADGINPSIHDLQNYPLAETPWIQQILLNREMLFVPDVDALPDEYEKDRKELQRQQIQSVLCLPVIMNNEVLGYFGFDAVKQKRLLDEEQVHLMKVLANTLGEALAKVKAEKEMQLMNVRYDQLSAQTRSMTFEIDRQGLYTAISPVVKDLLGYEPEEVIGKMYFYDFFPPEEKEAFRQEVFAQLNTREPVTNFVNQLSARDGRTVWVSTNSLPLFNDKNELTGYWGIDRDITEQTRLSEAIKYQSSLQGLVSEISRLFVSATSDNMDELVAGALKKAGVFFGVSRSYIYRFKPDGENYKLAYEWCASGIRPTPEEIRKETSFTDFPWWYKQISGNIIVIIADTDQMPAEAMKEKQALLSMNVKSLVSFPVTDKEVITGFLSFDTYFHKANWTKQELDTMQLIAKILSDALEKNKAEQALLESGRINRETAIRYQTYIDASNTGAWEYNRSKGYLWCSPQYFEMLGRDINDYDFSGKPNAEIIWKELIHPDDLLQGKGMLHYYLEKPQGTYQQTFRMLHKDGHYRWILSRGRMLTDENGKTTEVFIGTHIDISHQKNHEEALLAKNKELESYLYVASHDLRAPLVNIQGFSNRIQKQIGQLESLVLQNNSDQAYAEKIDILFRDGLPQSLSFILSNVQKMDSLINGLLAISRTGRMKMNVTEVDPNALFQKIVKDFNFQIEEVNAHVSVDKLLPCYGDYQLLYQLFSNLFDNALKYHQPEKPLNISVKSEKKGEKVIYIFKDTGMGINARNLDRIWDVFYQVDPDSPTRGEGIGLNLVEKIVEKHKGVVRVESGEGEGSTFFVELHARLFVH
ncbi:MAG: PAS domain S-box protein [Bacteroidetes bacterium]|nr:MAG: PAS domain S-box protein [Bacteroidota bacterium]